MSAEEEDKVSNHLLSRRWPRVFATLPRLRVGCGTFNRRDYRDDDHCEDNDRWLDRAAPVSALDIGTKLICGSGGLRELCITNGSLIDCYKVPSPVYNCQTLTSLELYCCRQCRRGTSLYAPSLENLEINLFRPQCVSVKKAPRVDSVKLGLFYGTACDSEDTDDDETMSESDDIFNFGEMEGREDQQMDEIGNLVKFLGVIGRSKSKLEREYSKVLRKDKNSVPMRLPKKCYLLVLQNLTLTMDHNHEAVATLVSCLLNSSPILKDLEIIDPYDMDSPHPLVAEFWEKQINAECLQNHLSTFLVMNATVLRRMSLKYRRWVAVQHEESDDESERKAMLQAERRQKEDMVAAVRRELCSWPRASSDVRLELCSC
ncbi:hypothetical protein SETIT_5G295000v2 [Setaria italica]|uniref:FBD domain-containing protein n=1 Tax=Setaria italica TaxID=4555 RepID=A0A368RAF5_SETIT|nr:hypothetical protein SETIT_5G295000v2 [Setaria italica]